MEKMVYVVNVGMVASVVVVISCSYWDNDGQCSCQRQYALCPHQAQHIPGDHLPSCCSSVQPRYSEEEVILLWLTCCVTWFLSITWSSSACGQCWCRPEWRLPGAASTQGMRTGAENQELSRTDTSNFRWCILKLFESAIKIINFERRRKRARIGPTLNAAPSDIDKDAQIDKYAETQKE